MKNAFKRFARRYVSGSLSGSSAVVCVSAALTLIGLNGCDNASAEARNAAATQTEKAAADLESLALMSVYPMTSARREDMRTRYKKFLSEFGSVPMDALPEQKAQLNAMVAEVHLGLSRLALYQAGNSEAIVNHEIVLVIQDLGAAIDLNSMAEAASKVDFSKTKTKIEQLEQNSRQRQNDLRKEAGDIQGRMDDLQKQIDAELALYDRMSNEAAVRKDEALSAPLDERRDILEEAAVMSRRADSHQVKAANMETALGLIKPKLATVFSRINQTETELNSFETSKKVLIEREKAAAQTAAARRVDLTGENGMVSKIKNELDTIYGNTKTNFSGEAGNTSASYPDVVAKFDKAISEAETAVAKAGSAKKSPGGEIRLIEAHQALGTARWRKAMFLKSVSQMVSRMTDEAGLLGRGEVDRALNQTIQVDIAGATSTAGDAFTKAAEAADRISSRNVDDKTKHRLVSELNDTVIAITGKSTVNVAPLAEEKSEELPVLTEESTVGSDDPREVIRQIVSLQNAGKFTSIFDLIYADTPAETEMIDMSRESSSTIESLNEACLNKLGVPLVDADNSINSILASGIPGGAAAMSGSSGTGMPTDAFTKLTDDDVNNLEFGYDAGKTTAWVTNNPDLSQINFVNIDGKWKIDINLPLGDDATAQKMMGLIKTMTRATGAGIRQVEEQVNNGTLTDIDAVRAAVGKAIGDAMKTVMEDMMKNMPQVPPSGGKGSSGGN